MGTPLALATLLITLSQAAPEAAASTKPNLVARVGEQLITRDDFLAEVNRLIPESFFHGNVSAEVRRGLYGQALDSLVEKSLIHQQALALGLSASESEIAAEFGKTLAKAGPRYAAVSDEERAALLESYRPLVIRRILRDKNERRFEATIPPLTEESLQKAYSERQAELLTVEQAHFQHIMARVDPSAGGAEAEAIQKRLESILARLQYGEDFGDLAREASDDIYAQSGGDMGFVTRGSFLTPDLGQAAFALDDGQTSGIIASIYGYHLIRRIESRPQRQLSYDEVKDQLAAELKTKLAADARREWIAELRETQGVEILDDPTHWDIAEQAPSGSGHHGRSHR